jgi:hypothetical protein
MLLDLDAHRDEHEKQMASAGREEKRGGLEPAMRRPERQEWRTYGIL